MDRPLTFLTRLKRQDDGGTNVSPGGQHCLPEGGASREPGDRRWSAQCRGAGQDTVPFLSCLEAQKLRFQGKSHFAALHGSFRPKKQKNLDYAAPWAGNAQKKGQSDVLVVDHAEKVPIEN